MTWYNLLFSIIGYLVSTLIYYALIANNPFSSELYIGKKGAGKSTFMARHSKIYNQKGWNVYANAKIPGTYYIKTEDIGTALFPENSVIMLDEAGIIFNNRNWKSLGMNVIKYMKYSRHYKNKLILFTQSNAEIDVSFMRICDRISLISNYFNVIGRARHLRFKQVLIPASDMAEARITDDIVTVPLLFGGLTLFWMPSYWKLFDSHDKPLDLVEKEFEYTPYPSWIKPFEPKYVTKERKRLKRKEKLRLILSKFKLRKVYTKSI